MNGIFTHTHESVNKIVPVHKRLSPSEENEEARRMMRILTISAIAGGILGAGVGFVLGTFVPVVGNITGSIAGGALGIAIGVAIGIMIEEAIRYLDSAKKGNEIVQVKREAVLNIANGQNPLENGQNPQGQGNALGDVQAAAQVINQNLPGNGLNAPVINQNPPGNDLNPPVIDLNPFSQNAPVNGQNPPVIDLNLFSQNAPVNGQNPPVNQPVINQNIPRNNDRQEIIRSNRPQGTIGIENEFSFDFLASASVFLILILVLAPGFVKDLLSGLGKK